MRRTRSNVPWPLVWLTLFFLSLRPFEPFQRAVDFATAPLRIVAELAAPLAFFQARKVAAAERTLAASAEAEAEENERLLRDLCRSALPTEPALLAGRRIVHAEVLGHRDWDHLLVRLRDPRGLEPGMPVACGNAFVGRLESFVSDAHGDVALVELATAKECFVGARVEPTEELDAAVQMTVGGVVTGLRKRGERHAQVLGLAVHYPSDRRLASGLARVHELFRDEEPWAELAEGLRLGKVERAGEELVIVPELDYKDGLSQVVVLAPADPSLPSALPFDTGLFDAHWVRARLLSVGDPSPDRSTRKVRVGRRHGVENGAAVTSVGGHLVGRVLRSGIATSDVALLDDLGFSLVVVARFEGVEEPVVLGRWLALGRDPESDELAFRWIVRASLPPEIAGRGGVRAARLFSGSGDVGLPAGFSLGEALLPLEVEPGRDEVVTLASHVEPGAVHTLFVRTREALAEGEAP